MVKAKNYKEHLLKQLQKPKEAATYLNAALHDDDPHVFLLALRDIVEAKSEMSWLAESTPYLLILGRLRSVKPESFDVVKTIISNLIDYTDLNRKNL